MSVAQYYPFHGAKNRLRMGLSSIPACEWIAYEDDFSARITEKKRLIAEQKNRVIQSVEGSEAAQQELLGNILRFIKNYRSDLFTISSGSIISHSDNNVYDLSAFESNPLELISYLAGDDFCILDRFDDDYRLVAASVCAPTYWELSEKMGNPMREVHAPIPHLEEKIGHMIRHFFKNLEPDNYYQRSNWFLMSTPDLTLFKDNYDIHISADELHTGNIMNKLYIRCERQSFVKLKQTQNIVFGIKIYVSPLHIVNKYTDIAQDLLLAVNTMTAEHKNLMGIDAYEKVLVDYLKTVCKKES